MNNIVDSKIYENPNKTIFQALLDISEQFPNLYALGFYGKRTTYKELIANVNDVAKALIKAGVKRGDAVTFMLPNCPQAVAVYYAISRIGAVANMVNPLAPVDALGFYINKPKSKFVVTIDSLCEKVKQVDNNLNVIFTKLSDDMSDEVKLAFAQKNVGAPVPNTADCIYIKDLIENSIDVELPLLEFRPDTTAMIIYTGGTTGAPKGVCLSNENINSCILHKIVSVENPVVAGKKCLAAMPLFHSVGILYCIHFSLCIGYQCILLPQLNFEECFRTIVQEKVNSVTSVPTFFIAMMKSDIFDNVNLSFLEDNICAGDTFEISQQIQFNSFLKEHFSNSVLTEGYGLSETTNGCICNIKNDVKLGSVGVPLVKTKIRIVKPDTFEDLPDGETGEIIISGPVVMQGYFNDPEETEKVLKKDVDGRTWLFTGDMCYTKDGYVYYVQRIKRMIINGGHNVYPIQVEKVVNNCECVKLSCVIGIKNKLLGQTVCACVILKDGYEQRTSRIDIINSCKEKLQTHEVPTKIVFLNEFPLTKVGKVDFMTLEKMQNEKAGF